MSDEGSIEIIARGVCVVDGQLLVCKNKDDPHVYLPGGHVEWVEETAESLRREILEEMGKPCEVHRFLGAVEHTFLQRDERRCEINLVFEMTVKGVATDRNPDSCEPHIEFLWVSLEDLADCNILPAVLKKNLGTWLLERSGTERWATA